MSSISFQYELEPERIIRGDFHPALRPNPQATVILVHGFKGFKDWGMFPYAAGRLAETFDVIRFNLSRNGVGASLTDFDELDKFGKQTFTGDLEDLKDVVVRVREGKLPVAGRQPVAERVVLVGHSRGGGESIVLALDEPSLVDGVVSWNGSMSFPAIFGEPALRAMREDGIAYIDNARTKQRMPLGKIIADDLEHNRDRFDMIARIPQLQVPLVLIQGTDDFRSLWAGSEKLVSAAPSVPWIHIAGGDHTFSAKHPFNGSTPPLDEAIAATGREIRERMLQRPADLE
jgi:pimeloyl-ACP methyl ester carboxylesterase